MNTIHLTLTYKSLNKICIFILFPDITSILLICNRSALSVRNIVIHNVVKILYLKLHISRIIELWQYSTTEDTVVKNSGCQYMSNTKSKANRHQNQRLTCGFKSNLWLCSYEINKVKGMLEDKHAHRVQTLHNTWNS